MRPGFTLIELLVVIVIIAIVMSFSLGAIFVAQESAREEKTRGLIGKIDQIIIEKYESFRSRRVPITMTPTERTSTTGAKDFAKRRLEALRELMRMELPDRWTDIADPSTDTTGAATFPVLGQRNALAAAYKRQYDKAPSRTNRYQGAECLYLILALSSDDRASIIIERNSGDIDLDGAPEILDGWGLPISFIRWPAGFLNSATEHVTDLQDNSDVPGEDHDPFDYRKLHAGAYGMYPLIYSGGPDRFTDIRSDDADFCEEVTTVPGSSIHYKNSFGSSPNNFTSNPLMTAGGSLGEPYDWATDGLNHLDNIHNHLLGVR